MPAPRTSPRPIKAEVRLLASSNPWRGSDSQTGIEWGLASPSFWATLQKRQGQTSRTSLVYGHEDLEVIGIAVRWPRDRRLEDLEQRDSTVLWVKRSDQPESEGSENSSVLYLPGKLLPPFSITPLSVSVHPHRPIGLSLLVLQPVLNVASHSAIPAGYELGDYDFTSYYDRDESHIHLSNGNGTNGHSTKLDEPPLIMRQEALITVPHRTGPTQSFKVLLTDPVQQGTLNRSTRIVISTEPHIINAQADWVDGDGAVSESSHGRTTRSMADFDPDAFLSASLDLHTDHGDENGLAGMEDSSLDAGDLAQSISETSGSITPRPNGVGFTRPPSPPVDVKDVFAADQEVEYLGTSFTPVVSQGPSSSRSSDEEICWLSVAGLGRAGIFEGDWVLLRTKEAKTSTGTPSSSGRLVKALAWERLDADDLDLPPNPAILTPNLFRSLYGSSTPTNMDLLIQPTAFGTRLPTLPTAKTMTLARIATTEGVDKRYERSWLRGLRTAFASKTSESSKGKRRSGADDGEAMRMVKRGDVVPIPIWQDRPLNAADGEESDSEGFSDSDDEEGASAWTKGNTRSRNPTSIAYFIVTSLSYEPLVPLEEDFRCSTSSKARAGELGCWVDAGKDGETKLVLTGLEKGRVVRRHFDQSWQGLCSPPEPFSRKNTTRLHDLLVSCFKSSFASMLQLSVLVKGARGSGKTAMLLRLADELGYNVVKVESWDIVGGTPAHTEGSILAAVDKAASCSPSILLLRHVEALASKAESGPSGRPPAIAKVLEDAVKALQKATEADGYPCILIGTTCDADAVPGEVLGVFKQEIELGAPNEAERLQIAKTCLAGIAVSPDLPLQSISSQSAALQAADIRALVDRAQDIALKRVIEAVNRPTTDLKLAGLPITKEDMDKALGDARASYSDSIGAPKIPNVKWEDVGGLADIKKEILETVQLPLERPELFADGLKKRSGILLYGPPGTGKTLLAKAVATTCSLNFFSVKGPELLNMYIGESEANVRRVFQRARDASPCIIFMDELDSVAPKRGNQGDSGGVMDRIVSQLLAELDGMSSGPAGSDSTVFVMGATNRPDLLDPALLRPGRFDRMLYLSVAQTHTAQYGILKALTRKFNLDPELDLEEIAQSCPFNYTGADFYALCSDAMLRAMTRKAEAVDSVIGKWNDEHAAVDASERQGHPYPLTPQYYLSRMARPGEIEVLVNKQDFVLALEKLVPSVSQSEMEHYSRVQSEFKGYEISKQS